MNAVDASHQNRSLEMCIRDRCRNLQHALQLLAGMSWQIQEGVNIGPVSYTHLDVYKRQVDTEGGLYLNDEDLAKLGFLYLNNGLWEGKQIVSEDWVKPVSYTHLDVYKRQASTQDHQEGLASPRSSLFAAPSSG